MAIEFTTANEATDVGGVKICVHAPSGVGKTVLMATLPVPILISAESGLLSLRKSNLERLVAAGVFPAGSVDLDVKVIKVTDVVGLTEAYNWCAANAYSSGFRSVGLDSISEIMETILANAKKVHKDPRKAYGDLQDEGLDLVRKFRDLPGLNVCVAAKQEMAKDEVSGISKYGPAAPGSKVGPALPYFFDEVFALRMGKTGDGADYRYLQTQPDLQYEAKDRSGVLAPMEYPHLGSVINKIMSA